MAERRIARAARGLEPDGAHQRNIRPVNHVRVPFGSPSHFDGEPVLFDSRKAINGHQVISGGTGTGKTHQLRRIIKALVAGAGPRTRHQRVILLDVHGDIVPEVPTDTVMFSESTEFGLNPLAIDPDPHSGGVRKRIAAFIAMLNRSGPRLGPKQEATLRALLIDLYDWKGFYADDPESWSLDVDKRRRALAEKAMPTLSDLREFTERKYRTMRFGGSAKSHQALEELTRRYQRLQRKAVRVATGELEPEALDKLAGECLEYYVEALTALKSGSGREIDDVLKYDSADTVKSVLDRIVSLEGAGIFRGRPPEFDEAAPVWRYNIKHLLTPEKKQFVEIFLEDLFHRMKQLGEADGPEVYVVMDESALFMSDDRDYIVNVIIREARKFGLAMILASQSMHHYSDDVLMGAAVKIILGVAEEYQEAMRRRLGLEMVELKNKKKVNPFSFLKPRQTALVHVKNHTNDGYGRLIEVRIAS